MADENNGKKQSNKAKKPFSVVKLTQVTHRYGNNLALDNINLELPAGSMVGFIGPDGVGKSSLLALIAGARAVQNGDVEVLGGNMRSSRFRTSTSPRIAYMPQGLGKNLYPTDRKSVV